MFPVHLDGTLLDIGKMMQSRNDFFDTLTVLQLFRQVAKLFEDFLFGINAIFDFNSVILAALRRTKAHA